MSVSITLGAVAALLLMFKSTRLTGIAALTLLSLVFPQFLLVALAAGGAALVFRHNAAQPKRDKLNGLP